TSCAIPVVNSLTRPSTINGRIFISAGVLSSSPTCTLTSDHFPNPTACGLLAAEPVPVTRKANTQIPANVLITQAEHCFHKGCKVMRTFVGEIFRKREILSTGICHLFLCSTWIVSAGICFLAYNVLVRL